MMDNVSFSPRGFAYREFEDLYGSKCSIQDSSLATDHAIWLGIDDAEPKIMASHAETYGIKTDETTGWVDFPIPKEVSLTTRMHLNKQQASELVLILTKFIKTGSVNN